MWNMHTKLEDRSPLIFGLLILLLLFWSAYDYGGRYLHVQTLAQVLSGGLIFWSARRFQYPLTFQALKAYPLLGATLLWFLGIALSFTFSANQLASLEEMARLAMYFGLSICSYLWLQQIPTAEQRKVYLEYALRSLVAIGLIMAGLGWIFTTQSQTLAGTFARTNDLAGYLLLMVPLAVGGFFHNTRTLWRSYYGLSSVILIISLISTNSRTSWIAMVMALLTLSLVYRQHIFHKKSMLPLGLIGLIVVAGIALNWQTLGPRLSTLTHLSILKENATSWRLQLLTGAWDMFRARPVLGQGIGTYGIVLPEYMRSAGFYSVNPHNYYLQILAETGIVGGICFLVWLFSLLKAVLRKANPYSLSLGCALMASLIHIAFDIDWSVSAIPLLFFTLTGLSLSPIAKHVYAEVEYVPYVQVGRTLLALFGLALVVVPSLNYFSANAYLESIQAQNRNDIDTAQQKIRYAMMLAPWPSGKHFHAQASFYRAQQQPAQALLSSLKSIQLDPHNARYYRVPSQILLQDNDPGNDAQAAQLLERRLELNPYRHPEVYGELAEVYWRFLKQPEKAREVYQQGLAAFSENDLARYEKYTPADRYEVFMLWQGLAALDAHQGDMAHADVIHQQTQAILKAAHRDAYISAGSPTPTAAIESYWQAIEANNPALRQRVVHAEAPFKHPPAGVFDTVPLYRRAERGLDHALLQYQLKTTAAAQAAGAPQFLWFETQLVADTQGWKLIAHRPIDKSTVFFFED